MQKRRVPRLVVIAMTFRFATRADCGELAVMNRQLIEDEGHRNPMTVAELEKRMEGWLDGEYEAVIFSSENTALGYALYRRESEYVYLRQFFVDRRHRRHGIGQKAMRWMIDNIWQGSPRLRTEALVGNEAALAFYRALGFEDYCVTLEMPLVPILDRA